jgi:mono/diheme cytochrome c family protein
LTPSHQPSREKKMRLKVLTPAYRSRYSYQAMFFRTLIGSAIGVFALTALISGQAPAQQPAAAPVPEKSLWDGAYTGEQARLGEFLYGTNCSACHAPNMTGRLDLDGDAFPLIGSEFWRRHEGKGLNETFAYMRTRMPRGAEGSLRDRDYAAILAYILEANGYPAGMTELPATAAELAAYKFTDAPAAR